MSTSSAARELDLNLHLLDRQVVDRDGKLVCKVDDLELERGTDGSLYVAAILVGSRALGPRTGGRLGLWINAIARRLSSDEVNRIDFALVSDIGSAITLSASRADLHVAPLEDWVREKIIARVPGSGHASR
jgi:sporulation protein YlmC with PRC-barrel domain